MNRYYALGIAVAVAVVLTVFWPHLLLWFIGVWPVPAGTSPMYQFWSGFFIVIVSVVGSAWLRKQNCHVRWCWRLGQFQVQELYVCRHHHPNPEIHHNRVTHEHVIRVHKRGNNPGG